MLTNPLIHPPKCKKPPVLLIPSSASSAKQWESLATCLDSFRIIPFDLYGHGSREAWPGSEALTLAQEAAAILDAVPDEEPLHLVGHSYGGGVALKFALRFPHRLRSLTLIEPSCFHLLRQAEGADAELLAEIDEVSQAINRGVLIGDYSGGMQRFIDYWSGAGAWESLSEERKTRFARLAVHVAHHFWGLNEEKATLDDYARIEAPTLVICGTESPRPSRAISRILTEALPNARHSTISWAGHMSPMTHPKEVNRLIRRHLMDVDALLWSEPSSRDAPEMDNAFAEDREHSAAA